MCKRQLGLLPQQCYPAAYSGECDRNEFELKKCMAFAADPQSAAILYKAGASRADRVNANLRLQKKLRAFNAPCTP